MERDSPRAEPQVKEEELPFNIVIVKTEDDEEELHQRPTEDDSKQTNGEQGGPFSRSEHKPFSCSDQRHTDSSDTDHSDDYSHQKAPGKRSYAMVPPDATPFSCSEPNVTDSRPFSCSECGKVFRCNSELHVHVLRHAEQKPFVCPVCGRGFVRRSDLARHQTRAHHVCAVCSQRFPDKGALDEHLQGHVEAGTLEPTSHLVRAAVRPFSCSDCGLSFRWRSHLQSHVSAAHRGERPHRCDTCTKSFGFKSQLLSHMMTHSGEKPFSCSVCSRGFALKSTLKQHMKTHSGERPFSCSFCDKGAVRKKDVTWHEAVVHHVCPVCNERFEDREPLGRHLQTHDTTSALVRAISRPFSCSVCDKSFPKNSELKRHMSTHNNTTNQT